MIKKINYILKTAKNDLELYHFTMGYRIQSEATAFQIITKIVQCEPELRII